MNSTLKPHHLIAHVIPGFIVVIEITCVVCLLGGWSLKFLLNPSPIFLLVLASFIVGQIIDAIRSNIIEDLSFMNRKGSIDWDFFFLCQDQKLENLHSYYFVYYLFDVNILIVLPLSLLVAVFTVMVGLLIDNAFVLGILTDIAHAPARIWAASALMLAVVSFAAILLYRDALSLRAELSRHTFLLKADSQNSRPLPHIEVYTRLKPSKIRKDGIGVFAITHIPKRTEIFAGDLSELVWIQSKELDHLPTCIRQLYDDFCVIKEKGHHYGCPKSFNCLTVAWYLNHSKNPNVIADDQYNFFAKEDIEEGEELTIDYDSYNQWRLRPAYLNQEGRQEGRP